MNRTNMNLAIFPIGAVLLCSIGVRAMDTALLTRYAFEKRTVSVIPSNVTVTELKALLETHVQQWMDAGRLAPLMTVYGIGGRQADFETPADTFQALALAYPHLSPGLQAQVRTFLQTEWASYRPHVVKTYDPAVGGRREMAQMPSSQYTPDSLGQQTVPYNVIGCGATWLYAERMDAWTEVDADWAAIRAAFDESGLSSYTVPANAETGAWYQNAVVAGLIGFVRLTQHAGQAPSVTDGINRLNGIIDNRLANAVWRNTAALSSMENGQPDCYPPRGRGLTLLASGHRSKIPQLLDLSPEMGRILREQTATGNLEGIRRQVVEPAPAWWAVRDTEPFLDGENNMRPPDFYRSIFAADVFVWNDAGDPLAAKVDIPWCRGDCYYIERLVYAIEGYGTPAWVDVRTGQSPLAGFVSVAPSSGTVPLSVQFTGSASGGYSPYAWSWSFGDGASTGTSQSPSHVYNATGTFTATLTVTDSSGTQVTANAQVMVVSTATVQPPIQPPFDPQPQAGPIVIKAGPHGYATPQSGVTISVVPEREGEISVKGYSLSGRLVWSDARSAAEGSVVSFTWTAAGIASGVYVVVVDGAGLTLRSKVVVVR